MYVEKVYVSESAPKMSCVLDMSINVTEKIDFYQFYPL
jgi:hypothetical protein